MSEKSVNKLIRKILEQDLALAVAEVLRGEALGHDTTNRQAVAETCAKTLGRFEASVRQGPPPATPAPGPAKWGNG